MKSLLSMLVLGLLWLPGAHAAPQEELPLAELSVGMYRIHVEVADNAEKRRLGLMHRESMAEYRGMIFVFDDERRHCMWMKNTLIPLSVAFIDSHGEIINIRKMHPRSTQNHCAGRSALYALEMNQGWFEQRGIEAGMTVDGLEELARD